MKVIMATCLAISILLSIPFASSDQGSSATAQVVRKTKKKSKYVYRRSWNGTKWVYTKTKVKTASPRRKTWRAGRKVVSRTKKVLF